MNFNDTIDSLKKQYEIVGQVDLDHWHTLNWHRREDWIRNTIKTLYRDSFDADQRIIFTLSQGDVYNGDDPVGEIFKTLQFYLNQIDITNFFVILVTNQSDEEIAAIKDWINNIANKGIDTTQISVIRFDGSVPGKRKSEKKINYNYNSSLPMHIELDQLAPQEEYLLTESKTFCIYPWIHLHVHPTGNAYPCCFTEQKNSVGNAKTHTLQQLWNSNEMKQLRLNMLNDRPSEGCARCYEQENSDFFSGRRSINKHFGHHIHRIHETQPTGQVDRFEMIYWDIRFSNLCNLRCRSCGHIFSSQWYQDQAKLAGSAWKEKNQVLNYAGRTETDMWEQLEPHLEYVEQIYFAGGEPLLMEEHYNILEHLLKRGRTNVRLIYNTNFTHTDLKGRSVFEYWKQFESVAVGASLDDSGSRAEYIRKGTDWAVVEQNRVDMLKICPTVDFYISPTLSIMNALHLPDFHRDWVERGLLKPQDLNVNILQDPEHYRIDIAPRSYKDKIQEKYQQHLDWLRDRDPLQRATSGFESAIKFMNATDNTQLIDQFWRKTHELDCIRNENILDIIPELKSLK